jgi:hypothetical protein
VADRVAISMQTREKYEKIVKWSFYKGHEITGLQGSEVGLSNKRDGQSHGSGAVFYFYSLPFHAALFIV